jgi:hypothetical protein
MHTLLASAHTWFFDSSREALDGSLVVTLCEGIKGTERQFVEAGDTKLGPYFPVQVQVNSRCVQVIFTEVLAWFCYNESFDTADPTIQRTDAKFLFEVQASSFREFCKSRTTVTQLHQGALHEYLLTCEDRIVQVLAGGLPKVVQSSAPPDLTVERTSTWSAN